MSAPAFTPSPQCWHPHPMLHLLTETILEQAQEIGRQFRDPQDDWMPVAFFAMLKRGKRRGKSAPDIDIVPIPSILLNNGESKELIGDILHRHVAARIADDYRPLAACFIVSAWFMRVNEKTEQEADATVEWLDRTGLKDEPGKLEVVVFHILTSQASTLLMAEIDRDGFSPPRLGEFKPMIFPGNGGACGFDRFLQAVQPQLVTLPAPEEVGL